MPAFDPAIHHAMDGSLGFSSGAGRRRPDRRRSRPAPAKKPPAARASADAAAPAKAPPAARASADAAAPAKAPPAARASADAADAAIISASRWCRADVIAPLSLFDADASGAPTGAPARTITSGGVTLFYPMTRAGSSTYMRYHDIDPATGELVVRLAMIDSNGTRCVANFGV